MNSNRVRSVRFTLGVLAVLFVCGLPSPVSAQWMQSGIDWRAWPSDSSAGGCFGNCGAGCSGSPNGGCGGGHQMWTLTFTSGPNYVGSGSDYECDSGTGNLWKRPFDEYAATGTWTYHGWVMPGCISHDVYCNQYYIGCLLFFGCGSPGWEHTWSYGESLRGYVRGGWEYAGSC